MACRRASLPEFRRCILLTTDDNIDVGFSEPLEAIPNHDLWVACADDQSPRIQDIIKNFQGWVEKQTLGLSTRADHPLAKMAHTIRVQPNADPVNMAPYRIPWGYRQELRKQIKELLDKGLIRHSDSPWSAPALFVPKKDQLVPRLCCDFRHLNAVTRKNAHPLPRIDELLIKLRGGRIFSKIDLKSGFHQIPLTEECKEMTAFSTAEGHYEWTVLPFGVTNGPSTFVTVMNKVFEGMEGFVAVYIDDIAVFSATEEEHTRHLQAVFDRLRMYGLIAHPRKCSFAQTSITFAGYFVQNEEIRATHEHIDKLQTFPKPRTIKQLQRFLGVFNYSRDFVPHAARMTQPLQDILIPLKPSNRRLTWNPTADDAFDRCRSALLSRPALVIADPTKPFTVTTDASRSHIGATLQQNKDGRLRVVAYWSRAMTSAEARYPTHEREELAIVAALKKWRHLLLLKENIIRTDHMPLVHIQHQKTLSDRQARWSLFLSDFDLRFEHITGKDNFVADTLSRPPTEADETVATTTISIDNLCERVKRAAAKENLDEEVTTWVEGIPFQHDAVYVGNDPELKKALISEAHESDLAGHLGWDKTLARLRASYVWRGMGRDVHTFCICCDTCKRTKLRTRKPIGLLHPLPQAEDAWVEVAMDFLGHLPETDRGNDTLLVMTDRFTRSIALAATKATVTAEETAELFLDRVVRHHGVPRRVISDRDPKFRAEHWTALMKRLGTTLCLSTASHPETNGITERANRSILGILRALCEEKRHNWDRMLAAVEISYNTARHRSTNTSPFELDHGRAMRLPLNLRLPEGPSTFRTWVERLVEAREHATEASAAQKRQADKHRREETFSVGDLVLVKTEREAKESKIDNEFHGPYRISKKHNNDVYTLDLPTNSRRFNKFHASKLRLYETNEDQTEQQEQLYNVSKITGYREINNEPQYRVEWKGYHPSAATWETETRLREDDLGDEIDDYKRKWNLKFPKNPF